MNLKDYVKQAQLRPGASQAIKLTADGEWCTILVDPLHPPKDAKFGQLAMAVIEQVAQDDGHSVWVPRTLYLKPNEAGALVKCLPDDDSRVILTMALSLKAKTSADGEQVYNRDGDPVFNRTLSFDLFAAEHSFAQVGDVPARVNIAASPAAPAAEPPRAERPRPKPLT